jgi:hypothetical protein
MSSRELRTNLTLLLPPDELYEYFQNQEHTVTSEEETVELAVSVYGWEIKM